MTEKRNLTGIEAFLQKVAEVSEDVRTGRVVIFGTRRSGFNREETQPTRQIDEPSTSVDDEQQNHGTQ